MSRPISSLIPSIEGRLSAWQTIQARLASTPQVRRRPTLTLSRAFGCEGYPLAEVMKAKLEVSTGETWTLFDKALVERVAQEEGISLFLLKNLGDASARLDALGLHRTGRHTHDEAYEKLSKILISISKQGNAIIVGRGGAVLCHDLANCFHFRLEADRDFRIHSVMRRLEMSHGEAEAYVLENETAREHFISERLGVQVANPEHYHAVFNNARESVHVIAEAILAYMRAAWQDVGFFK